MEEYNANQSHKYKKKKNNFTLIILFPFTFYFHVLLMTLISYSYLLLPLEFKLLAPVPDDPWTQLRMAMEAVFNSWFTPRCISYRDIHNIAGMYMKGSVWMGEERECV